MKTLRFQDLKPERDDFELEDGSKVGFISLAELDGPRMARLDSVLREVLDASKRVALKPSDERAMIKLGASVDGAIRFVLPDLPNGMVQSIGLEQKVKILNWWQERNRFDRPPDEDGQGKPAPG